MAETDGQVATGTEVTQTTVPTTESGTTSPQTTTEQVGTVQAEETFFDPESIKDKPELQAAYKQMQSAFSKKTLALKEGAQKIQAYDQFAQNPAQALQQLARDLGYTLTRAQAQEMVNEQNAQSEFQPNSWEEVINKTKSEAKQELLKELSPFLNEVQQTRKGQIEKMLDDSCPDWRVYEDQMTQTLSKHPTLVSDPVTLYKLSVPQEVIESRYMQKALSKLQSKASSSQLSGGSSTNQTAVSKPSGKLDFNQAVEYAKAKLASQGIKPPH
jgi:hypothetical protein